MRLRPPAIRVRGALVAGLAATLIIAAPSLDGSTASSLAPPPLAAAGASATAVRAFSNVPTIGGCKIFPANNTWNTPVSMLPVRPESATVINATNNTGASKKVLFQMYSLPTSGFQLTVVPATQPLVQIIYDQYGYSSDPGPFPIPTTVPLEENDDKHIIVLQQGTCQVFELWAAHRPSTFNGWYAGTGAKWNLAINDVSPPYWTSADAAGLPILPGLLRAEEVATGRINHALRMTVGMGRNAVIYPATHFVGQNNPNLLPMGARLRLRADYNISGFTGQSRVIAEALKNYGVIIADNGPNWMISGVGSASWNDANMDQVRNIPATAFEYVDNGPVVLP